MGCCGKAQGVFERAKLPENVRSLLQRSRGAAPALGPKTGLQARPASPAAFQSQIFGFVSPTSTSYQRRGSSFVNAPLLAEFTSVMAQARTNPNSIASGVINALVWLATRLRAAGYSDEAQQAQTLADWFTAHTSPMVQRMQCVRSPTCHLLNAPGGQAIGYVGSGQYVDVLENQGGWIHVRYGAADGWLNILDLAR